MLTLDIVDIVGNADIVGNIKIELCSDDGLCWSETSINLIQIAILSPLTPWQEKIFPSHWFGKPLKH